MVADKSAGGTKGVLHPKVREAMWKPGQGGNPSGRAKKLTQPLEAFLARKGKSGKQYAQLLIEAMVMRAIAKSDTLVKEIFERVEGRVPNDPAQGAQFGNTVVVVDIPRVVLAKHLGRDRGSEPPFPETMDRGGKSSFDNAEVEWRLG